MNVRRVVMSGLATLCLLVLPAGELLAQQDFETTEIAEGVFQFRWRGHNGFFVDTPQGVIAIDPISVEAAAQYAEEIRKALPGKSLVAVGYSHDHADHATGALALTSEFGGNVPIIAHENAIPKIMATGNADLPVPTLTFSDRMVMSPGRTVEFHYLGRNHSDNSMVVYVPDVKVAFVVDFASNDRVGFRELPDYHFPEFFTSLSRLLELDFETVVFGHGPAGDRAAVQRQIRYYDDLRTAVSHAVDEGLTEDQAAERISLPEYASWSQYEAWLPLNVRAIYRWIAGQ
ncbi:MAG: MBL fold metallo-hydrolase [Gemmatimonadetes bacterium]|nr:MBL fold metallo-hydrolase [Gemmatimonadota bacterium]